MQLTFTHTEYHAEPEREAIWILTADVDTHEFNKTYERTGRYYTANIQTALTHEGPVKISDIDPRLLAEMEQAAVWWVNDGRESLPKLEILCLPDIRLGVKSYGAFKGGKGYYTGSHAECFNALLQHINTPQTQS